MEIVSRENKLDKAVPKQSNWRAKNVLELVHSDLCGPINPISSSGKRYFLSLIDDHSRKGFVYLLLNKSDTLSYFKIFKSLVENEPGRRIKCLRTDRGGEYLSSDFKDFCNEHGIRRQLTNPYTPQQNGVAERRNRTIMNMVRSMLISKNMPKMLWTEAVVWAVYILNRCPTLAVKHVTPQEAWSGRKPSVKYLKVWGCLAHTHVPKVGRSKLDARSSVCIFLGIDQETKGYRLFDVESNKVITSKDVTFEEDKAWDWGKECEDQVNGDLEWEETTQDHQTQEGDQEQADQGFHDEHSEEEVTEVVSNNEDETLDQNATQGQNSNQGREHRAPRWMQDFVTGGLSEDGANCRRR